MKELGKRVAVIVATVGRAKETGALLDCLARQTYLPQIVVLSVEGPSDLPQAGSYPFEVTVLMGPRGSSQQRNRGLRIINEQVDFVVFLDDDFVPSRYFLDGVLRAFAAFPNASGFGGQVLADGARTEGIPLDVAAAIVDDKDTHNSLGQAPQLLNGESGVYGCNMAFRRRDVEGIFFDENVPLYGWLEDSDFGARLPGPYLYTDAFYGVHCAVKSGRELRGIRLGYSQIANPYYFWRKGTFGLRRVAKLMLFPLLANAAKAFWPEPWIDRRGRLRGNFIAVFDLLRGRVTPSRIINL